MATYVTLFHFTEKGIEHIKESPARLEGFKKTIRSLGGEIKAFFLLLGRYDTMVIVNAPDDETMARINLAACSLGNVRSETLRAFAEEDYRKMIASLP
jgi:uncharacterized protein with GYD domain